MSQVWQQPIANSAKIVSFYYNISPWARQGFLNWHILFHTYWILYTFISFTAEARTIQISNSGLTMGGKIPLFPFYISRIIQRIKYQNVMCVGEIWTFLQSSCFTDHLDPWIYDGQKYFAYVNIKWKLYADDVFQTL